MSTNDPIPAGVPTLPPLHKTRGRWRSLMMAETHVADWGVQEALREWIANAMDADPDYKVWFRDGRIYIYTKSHATRTQLMMTGCGTKSADSDTIGQFGEGCKLAALVLTRKQAGVRVYTPEGLMSYKIIQDKDGIFDCKSLHYVEYKDDAIDEGMLVTFRGKKLKEIYEKTFLPRRRCNVYGKVERKTKGRRPCKVYCRGVLVTTLPDKSLYDWNLRDLRLNRDRDFMDLTSLRTEIGRYVDGSIPVTPGLATILMENPECLESQCYRTKWPSTEAAKVFAQEFRDTYGSKAVLSTTARRGNENSLAAARGYEVVAMSEHMIETLERGGIKQAKDVLLKSDHLKQVPGAGKRYKKELDELAKLLAVIGCGTESFHVFKDNGTEAGAYDHHGVWLNQRLFKKDQRFERIRTMLHEMGHARGGSDESLTFENSLDYIAGKLGEALLETMV